MGHYRNPFFLICFFVCVWGCGDKQPQPWEDFDKNDRWGLEGTHKESHLDLRVLWTLSNERESFVFFSFAVGNPDS